MPALFLSYAHPDAEKALRLHNDLTQAGIDVWLDRESLLPGQLWKPAIENAIRSTRYFVALLSTASVSRRGYVQKELAIALDVLEEFPSESIFVIPARLEECSPSHPRLRDLHWVDLYPDWDRGVAKILKAIGTSMEPVRKPDLPGPVEQRPQERAPPRTTQDTNETPGPNIVSAPEKTSPDPNEPERDHRRRRKRRLLLAAGGTMVVLSILAAVGSWLLLGPGAPREIVLGQLEVGSLTLLDHATSSGARYDVYHFRRTTNGLATAVVHSAVPHVSIQWGRTINGAWENLTRSVSGTQVRAPMPSDGNDFLLRVQGDKADARGPYSIIVYPGVPPIPAGDSVFGTLGEATPKVDGAYVESWSYSGRPWEQVSAILNSDVRDDNLEWGRVVNGELQVLETGQDRLTATPSDTGEYQIRVRSLSPTSHRYALALAAGALELLPGHPQLGTLSTADVQEDTATYEMWKVRGAPSQPLTVTMQPAGRGWNTYLETGRIVGGRWQAIERSAKDSVVQITFTADTGAHLVRVGLPPPRDRSRAYRSSTYLGGLYTISAVTGPRSITRGERRTSTVSRADWSTENNLFCEIWKYQGVSGGFGVRVTSNSESLYFLSWEHYETGRWITVQRFGSSLRNLYGDSTATGTEIGLIASVGYTGSYRIRVCKPGADPIEYTLEVG